MTTMFFEMLRVYKKDDAHWLAAWMDIVIVTSRPVIRNDGFLFLLWPRVGGRPAGGEIFVSFFTVQKPLDNPLLTSEASNDVIRCIGCNICFSFFSPLDD
jgi:hypothetical protein